MKKSLGYALIEILIVLSIIVLFSALSLAYYRGFDEQKKLDAETKQLIDILNLASKKSSSADLPPDLSCSNFLGYQVISMTTTTYTLRINCGGGYTDIQSYTLRTSLTFSGPLAAVLFNPITAEANSSTFTLTNTVTNKCIYIQINPVGTVEERPNCP